MKLTPLHDNPEAHSCAQELYRSCQDFTDFASRLLEHCQTVITPFNVVVWEVRDDGDISVRFTSGPDANLVRQVFEANQAHTQSLQHCLEIRQSAEGRITLGLMGECRAWIIPLSDANHCKAILEIVVHASTDHPLAASDSRQWLAGWLSRMLYRQSKMNNDDRLFWRNFDHVLTLLYQQESANLVAQVISTDGRIIVGCDRISVIKKIGRRSKVLAISGVETIQRKSSTIRSLRHIASASKTIGRQILFPKEREHLPEGLVRTFTEHVTETRANFICVIPLEFKSDYALYREQSVQGQRDFKQHVGWLVVEQFASEDLGQEQLDRLEMLAHHGAIAIKTASRFEAIPLSSLWIGLYEFRLWIREHRFLSWVATIILTLLCLGLAWIPYPYYVSASGRAMPTAQHSVFAPLDSRVDKICVGSGQIVEKGTTLLILKNEELTAELETARSRLAEQTKIENALQVQMERASEQGNQNEALQLQSELVKSIVEANATKERLTILEQRDGELTVRAPSHGIVVTFQPETLLQNRPVGRGDLLLEVMEIQGDWRLEIEIPESRVGHVLEAMQRNHQVPIRYLLMEDVSRELDAQLSTISTRSDTSRDQTTIVEAFAQLETSSLNDKRVGMEVHCRLNCGNKSLFYCIFGDVVEFVQRNVWW